MSSHSPRRARATLLGVGLAIGLLAMPALAAAAPTASVFARGIDNPRHLAFGANGTLYVAAGGTAGPECLDRRGENCFGFTGRVLAIDPLGVKRVVADGLLSGGSRDGSFAGAANGVAVAPNGTVVTVMGSGTPQDVAQFSLRARQQAGELVQVAPVPREALGSIDSFEWANNSDRVRGDRNSNPYAVLALADGSYVVADAGANAILKVKDRQVSLLAVIPPIKGQQAVPTALALGPDGNIYVGTLALGAGKGNARIYKVAPTGGTATIFSVGYTAITGLAFAPNGSLYVTQFTTDPRRFAPTGSIVKVATDRTRTTFTQGIVFPTGAAVAANGDLYVSNYSVAPARTPRRSPFRGAGGQIIKITGF